MATLNCMMLLMNKKRKLQKALKIPSSVRVVFILSDGKKHFLTSALYNELREIYDWFGERLEEFQSDLDQLAATTRPGTISVLEINSDGTKKMLQDIRSGEYSNC